MEKDILFLLCVWGSTHIIVSSKITKNTRDWFLVNFPKIGELLGCYQCTGFWVSLIIYFFIMPTGLMINDYLINFERFDIQFSLNLLDPLFWGFIGAGTCSLLSFVSSYLLRRKDI